MREGLNRIRPNAVESVIINTDASKDAFTTLEKTNIDIEASNAQKPTLKKLIDLKDSLEDDFTLNQKMRAKFRTEKKSIANDKEIKNVDYARCGMVIDRQ